MRLHPFGFVFAAQSTLHALVTAMLPSQQTPHGVDVASLVMGAVPVVNCVDGKTSEAIVRASTFSQKSRTPAIGSAQSDALPRLFISRLGASLMTATYNHSLAPLGVPQLAQSLAQGYILPRQAPADGAAKAVQTIRTLDPLALTASVLRGAAYVLASGPSAARTTLLITVEACVYAASAPLEPAAIDANGEPETTPMPGSYPKEPAPAQGLLSALAGLAGTCVPRIMAGVRAVWDAIQTGFAKAKVVSNRLFAKVSKEAAPYLQRCKDVYVQCAPKIQAVYNNALAATKTNPRVHVAVPTSSVL